ncbi:MAG: DNA-protecting protein DprA [Propionibacteriales bacterium]|nr:DNA-protecting protein DprA [Propionibacteriales bacterium]
MITSDERRARAALTRITEPGDVVLADLVDAHGAKAVVDGLRDGETFARAEARAWQVRLEGYDPDADLDRAAAVGARLVCPGDAEWPERLDDLGGVLSLERRRVVGARGETAVRRGGPPIALWVRGSPDLAQQTATSVAVVGSRAATAYGTEVSGEISYAVGRRAVTVVSGAAYGIDVAAHRGALAADAPTVAVLACAVDVSYPRGHAQLLERICESGLLVSEVPPGSAPSRIRFLTRNRLIAALTGGTVVVEAQLRSGALNTARWAQQLLRPVMGVPGPVTSALSAGVHELLRGGGAELVTEGSEVLASISEIGDNTLPLRFGETRPRDDLDDSTLRVLEAVSAGRPVGVERIARTAGLTLHDTELRLGRLMLQDFVERSGDRWRLSTAARGDVAR